MNWWASNLVPHQMSYFCESCGEEFLEANNGENYDEGKNTDSSLVKNDHDNRDGNSNQKQASGQTKKDSTFIGSTKR